MAMPRSITTFKQVLVAAAVLAATGASAAGGDAGETVKPVATHDLPNLPGKRLTAIVVTYAPGAKSARHHHAGSVWAYVLSGAIRSQNSATGAAKVYRAGQLLRAARQRASCLRERERDRVGEPARSPHRRSRRGGDHHRQVSEPGVRSRGL